MLELTGKFDSLYPVYLYRPVISSGTFASFLTRSKSRPWGSAVPVTCVQIDRNFCARSLAVLVARPRWISALVGIRARIRPLVTLSYLYCWGSSPRRVHDQPSTGRVTAHTQPLPILITSSRIIGYWTAPLNRSLQAKFRFVKAHDSAAAKKLFRKPASFRRRGQPKARDNGCHLCCDKYTLPRGNPGSFAGFSTSGLDWRPDRQYTQNIRGIGHDGEGVQSYGDLAR
jgi:hypothetical protein